MNGRDADRETGAALLIVLATLVLVVTATATLARFASTVYAQRSVDRRTAVADDLLAQAGAKISVWLDRESFAVALPVDVVTPELTILNDAWMSGDSLHAVRVTAYDQNGLVPYAQARAGSLLRTTLPRAVRDEIDRARASRAEPLGLDQLQDPSGVSSPFPTPLRKRAHVFGDPPLPPPTTPTPNTVALPGGRLAFGAYIATHGVPPGRININTAPMAVVEEALRMVGLGGIEQIRRARSRGLLANLGALGQVDPENRGSAPALVAKSDAWAFRIDIRVGALTRSWWAVYVFRKDWKPVQRLGITS